MKKQRNAIVHSIHIYAAPNMSPVYYQSLFELLTINTPKQLCQKPVTDFCLFIWETFIEQFSHSMLDTILGARDKTMSKPKIILT